MDHFDPFWSREYQNLVRNKVILTKMVALTILDHFGPVHFSTVPRPRPNSGVSKGVFLRGVENLNNWGGARTGCNTLSNLLGLF